MDLGRDGHTPALGVPYPHPTSSKSATAARPSRAASARKPQPASPGEVHTPIPDTSVSARQEIAGRPGGRPSKAGPEPSHGPATAYDNFGPANAEPLMCRGNPQRPESMPGGEADQTFIVPAGVASLNRAQVQIDRDPDSAPPNGVMAHMTVFVNESSMAHADAYPAGNTQFFFESVAVSAGDTVRIHIWFTATYGKIIGVYTAGSPGGTFTVSNSCSDGARSLSTTTTGLRAVISGTS